MGETGYRHAPPRGSGHGQSGNARQSSFTGSGISNKNEKRGSQGGTDLHCSKISLMQCNKIDPRKTDIQAGSQARGGSGWDRDQKSRAGEKGSDLGCILEEELAGAVDGQTGESVSTDVACDSAADPTSEGSLAGQ